MIMSRRLLAIITFILALILYLNHIQWSDLYGYIILISFIMLIPKFPMKLKMIVFILGVGVMAIIFLPFMVFRKRCYKNCNGPTWACRHFGRFLGITVDLRGLENVRKDNGSVVIMNHQSAFDLIPIAYLWPHIGKLTVVSKKELLYVPFFGLGLWLSGFLFIDRKKRDYSINALNQESKAINEDNCKLFIFPEGTRNSKNILLPFKKGAFHIAIQSQSPIQPILVSHFSFIYDSQKISHSIVEIMPEINIDFCNNDVNKLLEHCRNLMQSKLDEMNNEIDEMSRLKSN